MLATASGAYAGGPVTRTFFFTGAEQVYAVPTAATAVHVNVVGAPGRRGANGSGGGLGGAGGLGGVADADIPVTPGGSLFVEVGAPGGLISESGGFGGAGAGMGFEGAGAASGSGGGASDVRTCSATAVVCPGGSDTLHSRLLIAGGGGGGGGGWSGNDAAKGGDAFSPGASLSGAPTGGGAGTAGTPCMGGAGGTNNGQSGGFGFGGHGGGISSSISMNYSGGGGAGGGYCGGGGGGAADNKPGAGGGGGSSFFGSTVVDIPAFTDNTGIPKVTITYTDLTAPSISIRAPGAGESYREGATVPADYTCTDDQGGAGVARCNGTVPSGQPLDTSTPGPHQFTVTTADNVGNSMTRTVDYTVAATAATVSNVSQSRKRWREGSALPAIARARVGTTFRFTLDKPASVRFTFRQRRAGRRVGTKCVRPTRRNSARRRCTRTVTAGALGFAGHAGANVVRFKGRLTAHKRLKPGRYTLVLTTTTARGLKSAPSRLTFTIVRR